MAIFPQMLFFSYAIGSHIFAVTTVSLGLDINSLQVMKTSPSKSESSASMSNNNVTPTSGSLPSRSTVTGTTPPLPQGPAPISQSSEEDTESCRLFKYHMGLLSDTSEVASKELITTPLFTMPVLKYAESLQSGESGQVVPQYGFLAGIIDGLKGNNVTATADPRLFFNIGAPSSTFICGSQGSGKSHTLSCLLENCLLPPDKRRPRPLAGLVFHYDPFASDHNGFPCEAAFLSSNSGIKVRVLCSPANVQTIKRVYRDLKVDVEPLLIDQSNLNTRRMLDLMGGAKDDGTSPLYIHTVSRILRQMRLEQQETDGTFEYLEFKKRILAADLSPGQLNPLNQRLDTLESFMPEDQVKETSLGSEMIKRQRKNKIDPQVPRARGGNDWTPKPGCLTIVDLSCPCVTPASACSLFSICLGIFVEQDTKQGRVIALDEAHKYMTTSPEAIAFTNTLLSTIRLQRHLAIRIIISTQEPTISPALLDLCSLTIVHRFSSPVWLRSLEQHLIAAAMEKSSTKVTSRRTISDDIADLKVGEALVFGPSATIGMNVDEENKTSVKKLGPEYLRIKVRIRLTDDGGKSIIS